MSVELSPPPTSPDVYVLCASLWHFSTLHARFPAAAAAATSLTHAIALMPHVCVAGQQTSLMRAMRAMRALCLLAWMPAHGVDMGAIVSALGASYGASHGGLQWPVQNHVAMTRPNAQPNPLLLFMAFVQGQVFSLEPLT
jgi:hypothetical protein